MTSAFNLPIPHDDLVDLVTSSIGEAHLARKFRDLDLKANPAQVSAAADELLAGRVLTVSSLSVEAPVAPEIETHLAQFAQTLREDLVSVRDRLSKALHRDGDVLRNLGHELAETFKEDLDKLRQTLARLYRRFIAYVLEVSVVPPVKVQGARPPMTLPVKSVTYQVQVATDPSIGSLSPTGVVEFLTGLLKLQLQVAVEYDNPAALKG